MHSRGERGRNGRECKFRNRASRDDALRSCKFSPAQVDTKEGLPLLAPPPPPPPQSPMLPPAAADRKDSLPENNNSSSSYLLAAAAGLIRAEYSKSGSTAEREDALSAEGSLRRSPNLTDIKEEPAAKRTQMWLQQLGRLVAELQLENSRNLVWNHLVFL